MAKKKTCKRKRILNKDGSINKANVEHNKKCEKDMVKDNPWLNEPGGKEYAEAVLGKDHTLMKEIKKTKKQKKHKKRGSAKAKKTIYKKKTKKETTEKRLKECKIPCHNINEKKYKNKCLEECDIEFGKKSKKDSKKLKESKTKGKKQSSSLISEEKYIKKKVKKKQFGGFMCIPCISPIVTGLGVAGAGAGAIIGHKHLTKGSKHLTKGSKKSFSHSFSDGKNIIRDGQFELVQKIRKNKKVKKVKRIFKISQRNNKVTIIDGKKKLVKKFKKNKQATKFYNKKVFDCKKKGFKECIKGKSKHSKKK